MKLLVELKEDGPVTAEHVREKVELAILRYRDNRGLSADEDEGTITSIEVTIIETSDRTCFQCKAKDGTHHPACQANPAYRAGDWN